VRKIHIRNLCTLFIAPLLVGWLSSCLYSTQHFHTGVLLPAGHSQTTLGASRQTLWHCDHAAADTIASELACNENPNGLQKVSQSSLFKGSINYRLGLKNKWGPFPGAEMEWHLEVPTNPATMEFALNLGLPAAPGYHHKIGAGWGVGAWADKSIFGDYAISRSFGENRAFTDLRVTWLATQIGEVLGQDFSKPFPSNQHLIVQSALGFFYQLPAWRIAPDFIIPQFNITYPTLPSGDQKFKASDIPLFQWDGNLGFGWVF
jgi:hypothetical protein